MYHQQRPQSFFINTITTTRLLFILLLTLFVCFQIVAASVVTIDRIQQQHDPNHSKERGIQGGRGEKGDSAERFSFPSLIPSSSPLDSNIFDKLLQKLEHMIENVANNVTANIRFQVSQAIIDVLNKNQVTQVTNSALQAISQNVSTLLNSIPFQELVQNSLQNSQPVFNQVAKQLTDPQVIDTFRSALAANDINFSTIVQEILNATIQQLSNPQTKHEINTVLVYYAGHMSEIVPVWLIVLVVGVLISIVMIPSLLLAIIVQQVFPVRKMKWYQRVFNKKIPSSSRDAFDENGGGVNNGDESRHLVYNDNIHQ